MPSCCLSLKYKCCVCLLSVWVFFLWSFNELFKREWFKIWARLLKHHINKRDATPLRKAWQVRKKYRIARVPPCLYKPCCYFSIFLSSLLFLIQNLFVCIYYHRIFCLLFLNQHVRKAFPKCLVFIIITFAEWIEVCVRLSRSALSQKPPQHW